MVSAALSMVLVACGDDTPAQQSAPSAVTSAPPRIPDSSVAPVPPSTSLTAPPLKAEPPENTAPASPEEVARALQVAGNWVAHWARPAPGTPADRWAAELAPLTLPESRALLGDIDPQNVPATRVTGPAAQTSTGIGVVEADVPTDAGSVHVTVLRDPTGQWLVTAWTPTEGSR